MRLAAAALAIASALISLEVLSALWVLSGMGRTPHRPVYAKSGATLSEILYDGEAWGTWHLPGTSARLWSSCYDTTYRINSYGARDREHPRQSDTPRIVVLGDSFAEGFGVDETDRFTNRLERLTGLEMLNFGVSGTGPLSYSILYQQLAHQFDHIGVLVLLTATNDFIDQDGHFWREADGKLPGRYKPYYVESEAGFEIVYPVARPSAPQIVATTAGISHPVVRWLRDWTWFGGVLRDINYVVQSKRVAERLTELGEDTGYRETSVRRLHAVRHSLLQITETAGSERFVAILLIPGPKDLQFVGGGGALLRETLAFPVRNGIRVVDLAEHLIKLPDTSSVFFSCDDHWSADGNRIIANIVAAELAALLQNYALQSHAGGGRR